MRVRLRLRYARPDVRRTLPAPAGALVPAKVVNGGGCNVVDAPCAGVVVRNRPRRYETPGMRTEIVRPAAGEWSVVFYRFVTGARLVAAGFRSDCTGERRREHWTNAAELDCYDDFLGPVRRRTVDPVSPAVVAPAAGIRPPALSARRR